MPWLKNGFTRNSTTAEGSNSSLHIPRLASTGSCDQIILVGGGHIVQKGSHEELMAPGGDLPADVRDPGQVLPGDGTVLTIGDDRLMKSNENAKGTGGIG